MQKLLSRLNNLSKYFIAAIILAIPLYSKFPSIRIPGTFVSVRLEDFFLAFISALVFLNIFPRIKTIFQKGIERSILIYLGMGLVSLLSAIFLTQTVAPHIGVLHWLRRIEYFMPFFLGTLYFAKGKKDLEFFLKCLMVTIVLVAIYGLGQRYLHWPVIVTQNEEYSKGVALRWIPGSHINSTFAGHYDLATFLVLLTPIFISLFFTLKNKITKVFLLVVIFSSLWLLAHAVSRISAVSFLMAGSISLFLLKKYKEIAIFLIISIVFFGFSSGLLTRYGRIFEVTKEKLLLEIPRSVLAAEEEGLRRIGTSLPMATPTPVFEDRSTSIRLNVEWPRALRAFSKNPLLGTGYSSITLATDNDYLRLLGELGILGFVAFMLILVNIAAIFRKVAFKLKSFGDIESCFLAGLIGGVAGTMVNAFFIDVFEASKFAIIFWLFIGLAVGLIRRGRNE